MNRRFSDIEKEIMAFSDKERALMAQHILQSLDEGLDEDTEQAWQEEAERRYDDYKKGLIQSVSAEAAFAEARQRLK
ncbi:MAG: addiction module protein [Gammaproteobacteria bacterium]|nr:addiction module protein [Gammaproteobacteria bacterium]